MGGQMAGLGAAMGMDMDNEDGMMAILGGGMGGGRGRGGSRGVGGLMRGAGGLRGGVDDDYNPYLAQKGEELLNAALSDPELVELQIAGLMTLYRNKAENEAEIKTEEIESKELEQGSAGIVPTDTEDEVTADDVIDVADEVTEGDLSPDEATDPANTDPADGDDAADAATESAEPANNEDEIDEDEGEVAEE